VSEQIIYPDLICESYRIATKSPG